LAVEIDRKIRALPDEFSGSMSHLDCITHGSFVRNDGTDIEATKSRVTAIVLGQVDVSGRCCEFSHGEGELPSFNGQHAAVVDDVGMDIQDPGAR
jgi:hypothetical protein